MENSEKILSDMFKFYYEKNSKSTNPVPDHDVEKQVLMDFEILKQGFTAEYDDKDTKEK